MATFNIFQNVFSAGQRLFGLIKDSMASGQDADLRKMLKDPNDKIKFQKAICHVTQKPGNTETVRLSGKKVTVSN